ncbi:2-dehydropantoate 2-reductase [Bacillus sinesaloumensis]|uniref:2-dehydropantoate 2-reductase n=1 Tax=Litchfieldia sinesaloumensis TaxID=1926280 RepID=UPI00098837FC|nr:2-dehydropantoate 2-reductase [Bacillus sinesaloumensis]
MKIGIIGGGSIGLLFAGYLAAHHQVTVYTRTDHQAYEINQNGVTIVKQNKSITYSVTAKTSTASVHQDDLLFIAVKQYMLNSLLTEVRNLENVQSICFLQNGMSHIELIKKLKNKNILLGVVEHGALKINDTTVIHTGIGRTKLGIFDGIEPELGTRMNDFLIEVHENWYEILTTKLIANAVINPLTALYGVENGELLKNSYFYKQMKTLFDEIVSVVPSSEGMWELVTTICKNTEKNKSSMLRDIEEGRQTEIDSILGYVINEARKIKKEVAITQFLYDSIKGMEIKGDKG